jgi:outer membrane protein assembly factor BamB
MTTFREEAPTPVVVLAIDSRVLGIDPGTGEVRWDYSPGGLASAATALLVTPNHVFAASNKRLVCLDYPTGDLRWQADIPAGRAVLLLDGGRLFVSTSSGQADCFSIDGQHLWQNKLKGKGIGSVAIGLPGSVMQADESHH